VVDGRIDNIYLTVVTWLMPLISDSLSFCFFFYFFFLKKKDREGKNGAMFNVHVFREETAKWAADHPGTSCEFNSSLTLIRHCYHVGHRNILSSRMVVFQTVMIGSTEW
jgi:hypothetical protein